MKKLLLLFCFLTLAHLGYSQCSSDAVLAIDANCVGTTGGANSGDPTGNDPIDVNPCNNNYAGGDDYIFEYTATSTDALQLDLEGTGAWSGLMVTDACPDDAAATCVASSTSSATTESVNTGALVIGTTYYIHVSTWPSPQSIGEFCLNAELEAPAMPPANDDCANATPLTIGDGMCETSVTGTNEAATDSGVAHSCASYSGGDTWFSVTVPASGSVTIEADAAGGFTDGGAEAYSGTCGALTSIECDDDDGPGLFPLLELTGQTPGSTIYIAVWEFGNNAFGEFSICAWDPAPPPPPPSNDDCADAIPLPIGDGMCEMMVTGTNESATDSGEDPPSCGGYSGGDTWFSITVPASGSINIETSDAGGFTDGGMSAFAGNCGSLTEISCNDDGGPGLFSLLELGGLTPGSTILIGVWEFGNNAFGEFNICAWEPIALPITLSTPLEGEAHSSHNLLTWSTSSEINNEYQIIERSSNSQDWTEVGRVDGTNTSFEHDYQIKDLSPYQNTYYRLHSIDFDGRESFSEVILLNRRSEIKPLAARVSPNPFNSNLNIEVDVNQAEEVTIRIVGMDGKLIHTSNISTAAGTNEVDLDLDFLQGGIYMLSVEAGDYIHNERIIKLN